MEAQSRQSLSCPPRCRFALRGCSGLGRNEKCNHRVEDPRFNSELRLANVLEVRGEGATLHVPLDGSSTAFERLETCFNKRETADINPVNTQINSNSETQSTSVAVRINIDKTKQKMTVFLDGVEKYDWPVSTGRAGYSTPSGTY